MRADPVRRGLLFAGTEFGLYYSLDDGENWGSLQLDLPQVPITDLAIRGDDLIAATQGRGYWILDDLGVLRQLDGDAPVTRLYTPGESWRLSAGGRADDAGANGTNPHPGVTFHYALAEAPDADTAVELAVFTEDGEAPIWTWTRAPEEDEEAGGGPNAPPRTDVLTADAGLNRHVWDLRHPGMSRFDDLIMWADMREGPTAVPGTYRARLTVGETVSETTFEVWADPRSTSTPADYAAQFAFVSEARDLLTRTHDEIVRIRGVRGQLEGVAGRLAEAREGEETTPVEDAIEAFLEDVTTIEEALYQTKNESRQDPLNYPIRLNNKLTSLMRGVAAGDAAPTAQALAVKAELSSAIEAELDALAALWRDALPELERRIAGEGLSLVELPDLPER